MSTSSPAADDDGEEEADDVVVDDDDDDDDDDLHELLHGACVGGDVESVQLLLAHCVDLDARDAQGAMPLHSAAWNGHGEVVRLLLEAQADADALSARGSSSLHLAAQAGHAEAARLLLEQGATVDLRCSLGTSALQTAQEHGHRAVAELLLAAGARPCQEFPLAPASERTRPGGDWLPDGFAQQSERMSLPLRRLIVHGTDPAAVSAAAVVHALRLPLSQFRSAAAALAPPAAQVLLRRRGTLTVEACAALREAVEASAATGASNPDSVDGLADHQLDLRSLGELRGLVGEEGVGALQALPAAFARQRTSDGVMHAGGGALRAGDTEGGSVPPPLEIAQMFVRRYSCTGRPWFSFHRDTGPLTVNVALTDDACHEGGRLLALFDGRVRAIERDEGEATVHPSTLLHGVSRMRGGVRYSLIVFYRQAPDD